jgi:hypothetical protein
VGSVQQTGVRCLGFGLSTSFRSRDGVKKWDNLRDLSCFALGCGLPGLWLYSYCSCQNTMQIDSYLVTQVIDSIGLSHGQHSKLVDATKTVDSVLYLTMPLDSHEDS